MIKTITNKTNLESILGVGICPTCNYCGSSLAVTIWQGGIAIGQPQICDECNRALEVIIDEIKEYHSPKDFESYSCFNDFYAKVCVYNAYEPDWEDGLFSGLYNLAYNYMKTATDCEDWAEYHNEE